MQKIFFHVILTISFFLCLPLFGTIPDGKTDILHYEFTLRLNDSTDIVYGIATVDLQILKETSDIWFDFRNIDSSGRGMKIVSVKLGEKSVQWRHINNQITITSDKTLPVNSILKIVISYYGIPADGLIISKNKFGSRTFFSDHWPDRASFYLPVIDHPSEKAKVDFIIIAPLHYKVVANGFLIEESNIDAGNRLTHWKEEVPLPVKVMAFGVSPFAVLLAGFAGNIPVWTWVYPENRIEGFADYLPAVKAVEFFSTLIGPYPFEKLANVQSKTIFGGLENASCIFYAENSVTGKGMAESLIVHETAHQWFGNSVTEKEWSHLWLSEGFATYLTHVYMEKNYGINKLSSGMQQERDVVLKYDKKSYSPVIDTTVSNIMSLLNPYSYQKGAWVLHMLRREIGDEVFWKGIRLFYNRFRNSVALSTDFEKIMSEVSGRNLRQFFSQWLETAGLPELKIYTRKGTIKGYTDIIIEQKQESPFTFTLDLLLRTDKGKKMETLKIKDKITSLPIKGVVEEVIPDPEIWLLFRQINN
ncbi:MAG: M1 family metallopeptidase [Bacteroidales bacterium]|nr:M1 family metallopeptidase [Bacteroidales bacterium]